MEAKIYCTWMGYNDQNVQVPCCFDKIVEVSDEYGFDKETYYGWYVSDEDLVDGIYTKYYHHSFENYKQGHLKEFDVNICRIILKSSLK